MSWQEEEINRRLREKGEREQEQINKELRTRKLKEFLDKVVEANEKVHPDIRMSIPNLSKRGEFYIGKHLLRCDGETIVSGSETIYYDVIMERIVFHSTVVADDNLEHIYHYIDNEHDMDIFLRNLITSRGHFVTRLSENLPEITHKKKKKWWQIWL